MKKLFILIFALMLPMVASAQAFVEGQNYQVVRQQATAKPQVTEFFSLFCPHCYAFEPIFEKMEKSMPDVTFKRVHVAFLGGKMGEEMVRAYAVSEVLNVSKKMVPALFDAIQVQHMPITSRNDIRQIFIDNGVSGEQFDNAVNSFAVNGLVAQMNKSVEDYQIQGVPTVIVNGKYKVEPGSVRSVGEYIALVKYLAHKKD
ncbi:thiol:disulfide interchange protein DsbA/DsbL [Celerinatantimonas diazotrophica]|uniref:Thiol:disulfide interchange protein n=1 Tax=Celerinatantimonas diazotrophica TaxID=412034 RepID=A0A4R1K9K9_9GAMM|nr:thiol:disulfide interchange protein DsbA/DsbL [Celerinatantimonas diazotrophica]TCK61076.1 thiol:disulfide interchange protein DsbA [Celerinatantimonas diazotrophica]CAG9295123.1 Thiol:disulfide interchange protein DsbA [Celerinatantimonas diazotrophica]